MWCEQFFLKLSDRVAYVAGRPVTFIACLLLIAIWAISGPPFSFSETWQLVINTGTTIITFLMVFLIQNTQNRDNAAMEAKLDELIRSTKGRSRFLRIEHLTDQQIEMLRVRSENRAKGKTKVDRKRGAGAARSKSGAH